MRVSIQYGTLVGLKDQYERIVKVVVRDGELTIQMADGDEEQIDLPVLSPGEVIITEEEN
jgi:hypothetical protein